MFMIASTLLIQRSVCWTHAHALSRRSCAALRSFTTTVSYFTDVEGDWDYLNRFVDISEVVSRNREDPADLVIEDPNHHVVFGGDVVDKGGYDMKVLDCLNNFKRKYPENVHFIMGNRDCNKLRMQAEIGRPGDPHLDLPRHGGVYWFRGRGITGDPEMEETSVPTDSSGRLKWMLKATLGCPDSFEHRRRELTEIAAEADGGGSKKIITDEDVVDSYRASCSKDGNMGRYILSTVTALRLGPCLFVHGGLPKPPEVEDSKYWGTSSLPPFLEGLHDDGRPIDLWIRDLNDWCDRQKRDWAEGNGEDDGYIWATEGGYFTEPNRGGSLINYGMGWNKDGKKNPTVVYTSWLKDGMPADTHDDRQGFARDFFSRTGLKLLLSGHSPHGDCPLPIKINCGGGGSGSDSMILTGDTSYSGDCAWANEERAGMGREGSLSGRGKVAVSEILVTYSGASLLSVRSRGVLSDGSTHFSGSIMEDDLIGTYATVEDFGADAFVDGTDEGRGKTWWIKSKIDEDGDDYYLGCYAEGYDVTNKVIKRIKR